MPSNSLSSTTENVENPVDKKSHYKIQIIWYNVFLLVYLHLAALHGIYLGFTSGCLMTALFALVYAYIGAVGVTAGYHRLWCHRSYKARLPLRIALCLMSTIAGQKDVYVWCRDHRVHHKFTETDADPHNIKRGFFFAHMGWLMCKKHPDVTTKGKIINFDDLLEDPVVRFHRRFYIPMVLFLCFCVPTVIPYLMWNESLWNSFFIAGMARYCLSIHGPCLVNSAAHQFGNQPYDRHIEARENAFVAAIGLGEGWHNYHHVYPWDYSTSELGYKYNLTKIFIDVMGFLGLAYDMKTADPESIKYRMENYGDHSRKPRFVESPETSKLRKDS